MSLIIIPLPKKPIPVTTCAATLLGLLSLSIDALTNTNKQLPIETKTHVCIPAKRWLSCLSNPIKIPQAKEQASLILLESAQVGRKQYQIRLTLYLKGFSSFKLFKWI